MEPPLVVGVDGSEGALWAVDWAVDEAARHGVPLRVVYASLWERYEGIPAFGTSRPAGQEFAERITATAAERAHLRNPGVKLSAEVVPQDPATTLLEQCHSALAVVIGSRGHGELAGMLLGSVSLTVAARAVCPVIVVRGGERNRQGAFHRIVLGLGDAPGSSPAARFALREARVRGGELLAVRAWRRPLHEHTDHAAAPGGRGMVSQDEASSILDTALAGPGLDPGPAVVHRQVVEGPARGVLLDLAATADLLVVGARRRHRDFGLQLGQVNHAVLHHAGCPVAVVPRQG